MADDYLLALARRYVAEADRAEAHKDGWRGLAEPFELATCLVEALPAVRASNNPGLVERIETALGGLDALPTRTGPDTP